jgi:trimeric autotransporter adhesin
VGDGGVDLLNTYQLLTDTPPLLLALGSGCSTGVISLMIERGADVHATGRYGQTALMVLRTAAAAQLLLDAGAAVNARCSLGSTVLHSAAARALNAGLICCLLKAGADATATDTLSSTPADVAAVYGHSATAALLQRAAADQRSKQQQQSLAVPLLDCLTISSAEAAWRCSLDWRKRREIYTYLTHLEWIGDNDCERMGLQDLEFMLYKSAASLAEYSDRFTVTARVNALYHTQLNATRSTSAAAAAAAAAGDSIDASSRSNSTTDDATDQRELTPTSTSVAAAAPELTGVQSSAAVAAVSPIAGEPQSDQSGAAESEAAMLEKAATATAAVFLPSSVAAIAEPSALQAVLEHAAVGHVACSAAARGVSCTSHSSDSCDRSSASEPCQAIAAAVTAAAVTAATVTPVKRVAAALPAAVEAAAAHTDSIESSSSSSTIISEQCNNDSVVNQMLQYLAQRVAAAELHASATAQAAATAAAALTACLSSVAQHQAGGDTHALAAAVAAAAAASASALAAFNAQAAALQALHSEQALQAMQQRIASSSGEQSTVAVSALLPVAATTADKADVDADADSVYDSDDDECPPLALAVEYTDACAGVLCGTSRSTAAVAQGAIVASNSSTSSSSSSSSASNRASEAALKQSLQLQPCALCGKVTKKRCRRCQAVHYCSVECQIQCFRDPKHRAECEAATALALHECAVADTMQLW